MVAVSRNETLKVTRLNKSSSASRVFALRNYLATGAIYLVKVVGGLDSRPFYPGFDANLF